MESFHEAGLKANILKALDEIGFETPTPIQVESLSTLIEEPRDLIALAQTGTGKTAAFSLPILHHCEPNSQKVQALILSPTRELCLQIASDINIFTKYMDGVKQVAVYGGTPIQGQLSQLRARPQIVIGTPGRTLDLINRGKLDVSDVKWLVLDEADEMLSMGFKEDLNDILRDTPKEKTTLLFSATLAGDIRRIADNYLINPKEITIGRKNESAKNVTHGYFVVNARDRYQALKRTVDLYPDIYGIVFCRTRAETKEIAAQLGEDGYSSDALHGDLSQAQRDYVMDKFRKKQLTILVATDVAARGLDVDELTHVINYTLPDDREVYVHRSGRTGRAGKHGVSLVILQKRDVGRIGGLEKMIGKKFEKMMLPSGKEVCEKQLFNFVKTVKEVEVNEAEMASFLPAVEEMLSEMSREEIIKKFVSTQFNRFLEYYQGARDINIDENARGRDRDDRGRDRDRGSRDSRDRDSSRSRDRDRGPREERSSRGGGDMDFSRFFINVGKTHNMDPKKILEMINQTMPKKGIEIGSIEILKGFSFFELDKSYEKMALDSFNDASYQGLKIRIEVAQPKSGGSSSRDRGSDRGSDRGDRRPPRSEGRGGRDHRGGGGRRR